MLDFTTAAGAHPDHHEFVEVTQGCYFNIGFDRAEVPELGLVTNPFDDPLVVDVVDVPALFRDAPEDIVVALFERAYVGEDDILFRAASPCLRTGRTEFRINTFCEVLSEEFEAVWRYVEAKAQFYSHRVVIRPGETFATENRVQLLHFPAGGKAEIGFTYATHEGAPEAAEETQS